jgi:hypothetical protein
MAYVDTKPTEGRHFLQIPGPTNVPDRVLRAMDNPTMDHRGPEFGRFGKALLEKVRAVFKTASHVVIYPASGTGAWEAALANTLSPGDRVLMCETAGSRRSGARWRSGCRSGRNSCRRLAPRRRPGADRGAAARGQGARDQGGLRGPQRDLDRLRLPHRRGPQGDRRRRSPGAAAGGHHLVARLHRLPARRMGRGRHRGRQPEGADAAAGAVLQCRVGEGAEGVRRREAAALLLGLAVDARGERDGLLPVHAGHQPALRLGRGGGHAGGSGAGERLRPPRPARGGDAARRARLGPRDPVRGAAPLLLQPDRRCGCRRGTAPTRSAPPSWSGTT